MDDSIALIYRLGSHPAVVSAMRIFQLLVDYFAPLFLISSPITSYADQIASIQRTRSSSGFSLDIPLIMLVASILKVFYWFGAYFSTTLLIQALLMILVQLLLLKVALDHRPSPGLKDGLAHAPFSAYNIGSDGGAVSGGSGSNGNGFIIPGRPYNFWQWRSTKPYWSFLMYMTLTLSALHILLSQLPSPSSPSPSPSSSLSPTTSYSPLFTTYISLLGYIGLTVEAMLPIPQILTNQRNQSCRGFRVSVLAMWLTGDCMKMSYFFLSKEVIPWSFKCCGIFQFGCDIYLGLQYFVFGSGRSKRRPMNGVLVGEKDIRLG